jgi:tripartite-type tricarboxylate transporter receptor subunit TctC
VTLAAATTTVLVVHASMAATTVDELLDPIRSTPGKHGYATGGFGTQPHLTGEQMRVALGLDFVHVPFSGAAPSGAASVARREPWCGHTAARSPAST